jgi:glycosyltransferase involved in cell wall biosynthesis
MPPSLSIVIPVLNEENQVAGILESAGALLERRGGDWEIILVDNASTDRTRQYAEPFVNEKRVRYLRNDVNRGKGFSIRRGMLAARGDLRLMCDADCSTSLSSLPRLEEALADADIAVGSRLGQGAHVSRQQPLRRRFFGLGFLILTRLMLGRLPSDVYCGFKLWRGHAAQAVFEVTQVDGWVFDAEALAIALRMGYRVREVGIHWKNRPSSRLSIPDVLLPAFRELLVSRETRRHAPMALRASEEDLRTVGEI